jgi:hypothetical protein
MLIKARHWDLSVSVDVDRHVSLRAVLLSPICGEIFQVVSFYSSFRTKIFYLLTERLHKFKIIYSHFELNGHMYTLSPL